MDSELLARRLILWCVLIAMVALGFIPALMHKGWVAIPIGLVLLGAVLFLMVFRDVKRLKMIPAQLIDTLNRENLSDLARTNSPWSPAASALVQHIENLVAAREHHHFLLQQIVNASTDGILCYGDGGKVLFANRAFLSLIKSESLVMIASVEHQAPHVYGYLVESRSGTQQFFSLHDQGHERYFQLSSVRFFSAGEWLSVAIFTDVSQGMYLRERESWHRLLRILNHEIVNSVAPVSSLARVLADRHAGDGGELGEGLGVIVRRIEGMMRFAENIRTFSKLPEPVKVVFNFRQLVHETVLLMSANAPEVRFKELLPEEVVFVCGDAGLLQQLVIVLLQNAVDSVAPIVDPTVTVRLALSEQVVCLTVADNGPGVDARLSSEIFVPFFTTRPRGSGIGLSLARDIAIRHGGNIHLVGPAEPSAGAVFEFSMRGGNPVEED